MIGILSMLKARWLKPRPWRCVQVLGPQDAVCSQQLPASLDADGRQPGGIRSHATRAHTMALIIVNDLAQEFKASLWNPKPMLPGELKAARAANLEPTND